MIPLRILLLGLAAVPGATAKVAPGMARIPAGAYAYPISVAPGAPTLHVPAFELDVRPVTNADFLEFVRARPEWSRSRVVRLYADPGYLGDWTADFEPGPEAPADAPVVNVSWFAARAYAAWRGKRLPTIAEWERAALAGFAEARGADEPAYREATLAWYAASLPTPLPAAGRGRPNFYGVRDLVDLVWEWVEDFNSAEVAGGVTCGGTGEGVRDFTDYPAFMRSAFRSSLRASYTLPNLGFRCARSLPSSS
ncbi:MAG TPA: formylglycine-generating enzyme family protein [Opitutaceae bacterium]|nr:formylglycine-generating enzyme family protein [Opitutaceae bacterium]